MANQNTRAKLIDIASATAPPNPLLGEVWISLFNGVSLRIWDGENWILPQAETKADESTLALIIALS